MQAGLEVILSTTEELQVLHKCSLPFWVYIQVWTRAASIDTKCLPSPSWWSHPLLLQASLRCFCTEATRKSILNSVMSKDQHQVMHFSSLAECRCTSQAKLYAWHACIVTEPSCRSMRTHIMPDNSACLLRKLISQFVAMHYSASKLTHNAHEEPAYTNTKERGLKQTIWLCVPFSSLIHTHRHLRRTPQQLR